MTCKFFTSNKSKTASQDVQRYKNISTFLKINEHLQYQKIKPKLTQYHFPKVNSRPLVLSVKVVPDVLRLTRERRDPHDLCSLRTKACGTNFTRPPFATPTHRFEAVNIAKTTNMFRKKIHSKAFVLAVEVKHSFQLDSVAPAQECRDSHQVPSLHATRKCRWRWRAVKSQLQQ